MTQLAQIVVTDDQAGLLAAAADTTIRADEAGELIALEDVERESLAQLATFMTMVATEPGRFPLTGKLAKSLRSKSKALKGPATTASPTNKRKQRQEKRRAFHKLRRQNRREEVATFNARREAYEEQIEQQERDQAELVARLAAEPKFNVTDAKGTVIISGVPQSMIVAQEPEYQPTPLDAITSGGIVLPASVQDALEKSSLKNAAIE